MAGVAGPAAVLRAGHEWLQRLHGNAPPIAQTVTPAACADGDCTNELTQATNRIPQGFTEKSFAKFVESVKRLAREAKLPKGELAVQGSRVTGTADHTSDIDIILRVDQRTFYEFAQRRIAEAYPGSKLQKTLESEL